MTVTTRNENASEMALPAIAYYDATDPDEVHRLIRQAREQSPIAMGPTGLSYSPTTWCAPCCAIRGSLCRKASAWRSKASPPVRSGTESAGC